jgi:ferredoxin
MWLVSLLKKTFPNRRLIAKATNYPLIGRLVDKLLFDGDSIIYLPKDSVAQKTIEIDKKLDRPEEMVLPSDIVHHFIEKANKHWIMNFCICRDAAKCEDYPINYGCLFMGDAVDDINPKLGRPVTKEEAHDYARKCREAGLVHLIGRNKLDAQWLGVHPGEKLLPDLNPEIGRKITKMHGVDVEVTDACTGCETCIEEDVCFVNAISMVDGQAVIGPECRGCGRCVEVCPNSAIELSINDPGAINESIERVSSVVDVE